MKTTVIVTTFIAIFSLSLFSQEGQAPEKFQKQLTMVYETYINLKDAFVSSDAKQVKEQAKQVKAQLGKVDMELLEGKLHMTWMQQLKTMNESLEKIKNSNELSKQREAFVGLSDALYASLKTFGISGMTAYYQYCPMALDNKGAHWLSTSKEIRNPYFGDMMLKCGTTKETLNEQ